MLAARTKSHPAATTAVAVLLLLCNPATGQDVPPPPMPQMTARAWTRRGDPLHLFILNVVLAASLIEEIDDKKSSGQ